VEALVIRGKWGWSVFATVAFAAVLATIGILVGNSVLGWLLLGFGGFTAVVVLPYVVYSTGYELHADQRGLFLVWRGRQRKAFSWPDVTGMAWVQRYLGRGTPSFVLALRDGSTVLLPVPIYTTHGQQQAESLVDHWKRAVPGVEPLPEAAVKRQDRVFRAK
jgi:hypothetical protein